MKEEKKKGSTKKVKLYFDYTNYNTAVHEYQIYQTALKAVLKALEPFGSVPPSDLKKLIREPRNYCQSFILEAYKERNTMNLSYHKLIDVLELDTSELHTALNRIEPLPSRCAEEPIKESFTVYAETPEEINRLEQLELICKGINELTKERFTLANHTAYHNKLMFQLQGKLIKPRYESIKNKAIWENN